MDINAPLIRLPLFEAFASHNYFCVTTFESNRYRLSDCLMEGSLTHIKSLFILNDANEIDTSHVAHPVERCKNLILFKYNSKSMIHTSTSQCADEVQCMVKITYHAEHVHGKYSCHSPWPNAKVICM